jgi:hypothetical protein
MDFLLLIKILAVIATGLPPLAHAPHTYPVLTIAEVIAALISDSEQVLGRFLDSERKRTKH